jgi:hypothetical protein
MKSPQTSRSTSLTNLVHQLKILKDKLRNTRKQFSEDSAITRKKKLESQKSHTLDRGFLSRTREEHEAEVLGCRITVLEEDNEGLRSERNELEKANIGAQKLVTKFKE